MICKHHTKSSIELANNYRCPVCDMHEVEARSDLCRNMAELISELRTELQRLKAKENEVCEWQKISTYFCKTSHGVKKNDGDPYCPCCGKKIKIV